MLTVRESVGGPESGGEVSGGPKMGGEGVCRACATATTPSLGQSLFSQDLRRMFTACTGLQIVDDDGLPLGICSSCREKVHYCYNFIDHCKQADINLRGSLKSSNADRITVKKEETPGSSDAENDCKDDVGYFPYSGSCFKVDANNVDVDESTESKVITSSVDKLKTKKRRRCYTCPVCSGTFSSKKLYRTHSCKKFVCSFCSKGFAQNQYLNQHLLTHTGEKPYVCDVCKKAYKQRGHLMLHKRTHSDERPFKCKLCSLSFYAKHALVNHGKQHEGKHHLCHLCGLDFTLLGNLKVHMRVHTGEKPYACSKCSFRCSVQSGLRRHERLHDNCRPYACVICYKAFNNSSSLVRHERIHTGELPYKCFYCPKAFIDSWKRKSHLVRVHKIPLNDIPHLSAGRKRVYVKNDSKEESSVEKENA